MPYVTIKVTREGVSAEHKAALIAGVTELLVRVLDKEPATTFVVIEEIDTDNWGGRRRNRQPAARARPARDGGRIMSDERFMAVAEVVQRYFDGLYYSDSERLRQVFHPQAVYACACAAPALILDMAQYFPIVDERPSPASRGQPRRERIIAIEFAGPVTAFARLECAILPKHYQDFLTLLFIDGRWQIIAKVFHYELAT